MRKKQKQTRGAIPEPWVARDIQDAEARSLIARKRRIAALAAATRNGSIPIGTEILYRKASRVYEPIEHGTILDLAPEDGNSLVADRTRDGKYVRVTAEDIARAI